jgi:predicted deacylase
MNTPITIRTPASAVQNIPQRPAIDKLLGPLDQLADNSERLFAKPLALQESGQTHTLPRYVFLGPDGGGNTIRIGIFAAIHGDEPEGAYTLIRFATLLETRPHTAQGYALFLYPVCNPTGFEDGTRHSRSGKDLNREFWTDSREPEVRLLETEILAHAFDGIITLHGDNTSDGLYGFVGGSVLSENLLEPALTAAEAHLPRNRNHTIDGFDARAGIINDGYRGMLKHVPNMPRPPFEITFETPQTSPVHLQVEAAVAALKTILAEYRRLISIAQNI